MKKVESALIFLIESILFLKLKMKEKTKEIVKKSKSFFLFKIFQQKAKLFYLNLAD